MFTRDEIIMESTFVSDMTRLNVVMDMMTDNYSTMLYEATTLGEFYEAGNGVADTILSFISKVAEQIANVFDKIASKFESKSISSEAKKRIETFKKSGVQYVEGPNLDELKKIVDKSEKFIDKAEDTLEKKLTELTRLKDDGDIKKVAKEVNNLCDSLDKQFDKIEEEFKAAISKKQKISISKLEAMGSKGTDYIGEIKETGKRMSKSVGKFKNVLNEYKALLESTDADDAVLFIESGITDTIKDLIMKVVNKIKSFTDKHATFMNMLLYCLSVPVKYFTFYAAGSTLVKARKGDMKGVGENILGAAAGAATYDALKEGRKYYKREHERQIDAEQAERNAYAEERRQRRMAEHI